MQERVMTAEAIASDILHPLDTGPVYQETLMGRLPVEPWNTFSNLIFLAVVLYWSWRVYPRWRDHLFLAAALPVLFIGFIGGTLYHALRDDAVWLWMDWLPIVLLCLSCTILFARRAGMSWWRLLPLLALPFFLRWMMTGLLGWTTTVVLNVEYAVIGAAILAPLLLHMYVRGWKGRNLVLLAVLCFGGALIFRSLDRHEAVGWLSMGTHWLWHLFGGLAVHFLMGYIHQDDLFVAAPAPSASARLRVGMA
jgi:hypothetical protein